MCLREYIVNKALLEGNGGSEGRKGERKCPSRANKALSFKDTGAPLLTYFRACVDAAVYVRASIGKCAYRQ